MTLCTGPFVTSVNPVLYMIHCLTLGVAVNVDKWWLQLPCLVMGTRSSFLRSSCRVSLSHSISVSLGFFPCEMRLTTALL